MYKTSISISDETGQILDVYKKIYGGQTKAITMALERTNLLITLGKPLLNRFSPKEKTLLMFLLPSTFVESTGIIPEYLHLMVSAESTTTFTTFNVKKKEIVQKLSTLTDFEMITFVMLLEIEKKKGELLDALPS